MDNVFGVAMQASVKAYIFKNYDFIVSLAVYLLEAAAALPMMHAMQDHFIPVPWEESVTTSGVTPADDVWRQTHLGRLLGHAMRCFDERVMHLMAHDIDVPLALSNLAARNKVTAAHIHITRHLSLRGDRIVTLAHRAGMSKQAMADLVDQCEAWGLVQREPDPLDRRAIRVVFTEDGLLWLNAFKRSVAQAEQEFNEAVGDDVATVVRIGLESYAGGA